jgi:AraC-like DNA-binding protein
MAERITFGASLIDTVNGKAALWESPMFGRSRKFGFITDVGRLLEQSVQLQASGFRLTRMVTTGHELEIEVHGSCTLLVPVTGRVGYRTGAIELWANAGVSALLSRPNARWSVVDPLREKQCETLVFQFPESLGAGDENDDVAAAIRILPDGIELRLESAANMRLSRYLRLLTEELRPDNPLPVSEKYVEGMAILLDECLRDALRNTEEMLTGVETNLRDLAKAKSAETMILEHFREPLHVARIAKDLGMSVRSLQIAFKGAFGVTPRDMIAQVRLEHARARLMRPMPDDQVATVAFESGITHVGRFASIYKDRYGESPSETLARNRRTVRPAR